MSTDGGKSFEISGELKAGQYRNNLNWQDKKC